MKKVYLIFSAVAIGMIITACGGGTSSAKGKTDENQETSTVATEPAQSKMQTDDAKAQAYKVVERLMDLSGGLGYLWANSEPVYEDVDHLLVLSLLKNDEGEYEFTTYLSIKDNEKEDVRTDEYEIAKVEHVNENGELIDVNDDNIEHGVYFLHTLHTVGSLTSRPIGLIVDLSNPTLIFVNYDGRTVEMRGLGKN